MTRIEDWLALSAATGPAVSADGRTLWYLATLSGSPQIWRLDLESRIATQVTDQDDRITQIRVSPTDGSIIFATDVSGDERSQLRLLPAGGAPERRLTDDPATIHGWGGFAPDGSRIAFTANDRDPAATDLLTLDLATGARQRVFAAAGPWEIAGWHPDGKRLLALSVPRTFESLPVLIDVATGAADPLTEPGKVRYLQPRWRKDGTGFWCLSDRESDRPRLCWFDLASRELAPMHDAGVEIDRLAVAPDQTSAAILLNEDGRGRLRIVDLATGAVGDAPDLPPGVIGEIAWVPEGRRLIVALSRPDLPSTLWLVDLDRAEATPLPVLPRQPAMPAEPMRPILVHYPADDGRLIPAWFYQPPGPAPVGGRPALIWVHGGPAMQAQPEFRADLQWAVSKGVAVLVPNVRGSTGYGRAYAEADDHALRPAAIADVVAGQRWLAGRADTDSSRIAIMGQSYGGWMVLALITRHPDLWAAAVDFYGIADWSTFFRDTGPWRRAHRADEYGDPVADAALLADLSPLKDADRVTTPLLIAHGLTDPRVAPVESQQMAAALVARGHSVETIYIDDEGHGFVKRRNRNTVYVRVADFLTRHLGL